MSHRPLPPRYEHEDWSGVREDEGLWLGLCLICALSGFIVAAVILGLAWWLS